MSIGSGKITRVNINKLSLSDINLAEKRCSLTWSIRDGYPRISIFYGENSENAGFENMTILPFTHQSIIALFGCIKKVASDDVNDKSYSLSCINNVFRDGRRTDEKEIVGTVVVERDDKGIIQLKIKTSSKPDVRFRLLIDHDWFKVYDKNGTEITTSKELSTIYAKSYADLVSSVMSDLITDYTLKHNVKHTDR